MKLWDWLRHTLLGDLRMRGVCARCGYRDPIVSARIEDAQRQQRLFT